MFFVCFAHSFKLKCKHGFVMYHNTTILNTKEYLINCEHIDARHDTRPKMGPQWEIN